jgi:putative transposase
MVGQSPTKNLQHASEPRRGEIHVSYCIFPMDLIALMSAKKNNMSQSYVQMFVHIVFHTKNNVHTIFPKTETELFSYMGGILKNNGSNPIQIGGYSDHIHILCSLPKTMSLADLVEEVKKSSSKWIKGKEPGYRNFYWQDGYGAFSVGWHNLDEVICYIRKQKVHHQKISARNEYKYLMDENGVVYDEKYL